MSTIGSALSGLNAASARIAVSADNIANQFSKNYTPKKVDTVSVANGGVQPVVKDVTPATTKIFNSSDPEANADGSVDVPNVDLATEMVNMNVASYDYKANLKSIEVQKNLDQYLLDIFS
jgi:flagellar basal-body rod protein FlgC